MLCDAAVFRPILQYQSMADGRVDSNFQADRGNKAGTVQGVTGQLADWTSRGLVNSRTGQVADTDYDTVLWTYRIISLIHG